MSRHNNTKYAKQAQKTERGVQIIFETSKKETQNISYLIKHGLQSV